MSPHIPVPQPRNTLVKTAAATVLFASTFVHAVDEVFTVSTEKATQMRVVDEVQP